VQPQVGGGFDVRIAVLDQVFNVTNTTLFGGSREETLSDLAVDTQGAAYIIGSTTSTDLPTINPVQANRAGSRDGFLAVFHPQTLEPVFATYLGGSGIPEELRGVSVDEQGNIYVVGTTFSTDFPTPTPGAIGNQLRGRTDAFIIKIAPVEIAAGPDFAIQINPSQITVERGKKGNITIDVNRLGGFDGEVTVTGSNTKPINVKVKPGQKSTTGGEVKFKVKVKAGGVVGEHDIVFTATDRTGRARQATLRLVVQ
jgi:hypothetical protein